MSAGSQSQVAFLFVPAIEHLQALTTGFPISVPCGCQQSAFEAKTALCSFSVLGSGMDPDLQMDIITELDLVNTTLGVTQVPGLHNASKAFLFQGKATSSFVWGRAWGRGLRGGQSLGVFLLEIISALSLV